MKHMMRAGVLVALVVTGCVYEVPLTTEHVIPVDPAILGLWEPIPDEGKEPDPDARMLILKFSDTEYLIHYPVAKNGAADGLYYRGYPVKLGKVSCVQLQVIGAKDGPAGKDMKEPYQVVAYGFGKDVLEVKILNPERVDKTLKDSESLKAAFLKSQDLEDLFTNPGKFRRIPGTPKL